MNNSLNIKEENLFSNMKITNFKQYFSNLIKKYKMERDFKPKKISVFSPAIIKGEHYCGRKLQKIDESFSNAIKCFTATMEFVLDDSDLDILNANIKSLQIIEFSNYLIYSTFNGKESAGTYNPRLNLINLVKENSILILFHELLHMASSIYKKGICLSGFFQFDYKKKTSIGRGINEGYTDLLVERYFSHISTHYTFNTIEKDIATNLEKIIGERQMLKFYSSANLHGLVEELKKYDSYDNIIKFLNSVDFIYKYGREKWTSNEKHIILSFNNIFSSLLKWYTMKNSNDYENGIITQEELFNNINAYIKSLHTGCTVENEQYIFLMFEEAKIIVENIIINSEQKVKKR